MQWLAFLDIEFLFLIVGQFWPVLAVVFILGVVAGWWLHRWSLDWRFRFWGVLRKR